MSFVFVGVQEITSLTVLSKIQVPGTAENTSFELFFPITVIPSDLVTTGKGLLSGNTSVIPGDLLSLLVCRH